MRRIMYTREAPQASGDMRIRGYAATFDSPTELWPRRWEVIRPGAFRGVLARGDDARCLFNHDRNMLLGRVANSTLRIGEDERGLWYETDLNEADPDHVSVYAKIKRGDVTQSSFAFNVADSGEQLVERDVPGVVPDGARLFEIVDVSQLWDVSPVTYPAYVDTTVAVRSGWLGQWAQDAYDAEGKESNPVATPSVESDGDNGGPAPRLLLARHRQTLLDALLRTGGKL